MKHIEYIKLNSNKIPDGFIKRTTGCYYTHEYIANHLINRTIELTKNKWKLNDTIRLIDPFGGDGRLLFWFIKTWNNLKLPDLNWHLSLWDINPEGFKNVNTQAQELSKDGIQITLQIVEGDSFSIAKEQNNSFDIVVTNPPWELIKPDSRELKDFEITVKNEYVSKLREYDNFLAKSYPDSQPSKKFAGWGTNLSRVGYELCRNICKKDGVISIVMPASFLADDQSLVLRKKTFLDSFMADIAYFPAESRLFHSADVSTVSIVVEHGHVNGNNPHLTCYDKSLNILSSSQVFLKNEMLESSGYSLPISMGAESVNILQKISSEFSTWEALEKDELADFWAGRELDETNSQNWLASDNEGLFFIKGRMVERFNFAEPDMRVSNHHNKKIPKSYCYDRIAWRDVSRPSQKRRVIATIIPAGVVTGNSLGVAYFKDESKKSLKALLGIMSSLVFEFQLRCYLATSHISLSSLRKVRIPNRSQLESYSKLIDEVELILNKNVPSSDRLEALVAKEIFNLSYNDYEKIISSFNKILKPEKERLLNAFNNIEKNLIISKMKNYEYETSNS